jgi:4-hydroxybenzoate polyprenyltransferase
MLKTVSHLLSLIRFSHTIFALPFALLAAMMAWKKCELQNADCGFTVGTLLGILLCMVFARSAAMAFNRLVDRKIDAGFTAACGLAFVASTLLFLPNRLPLYLSVPVLTFLCGYSFAKRFTAFAHVWLGTALALSPVAVWIAIRGEQVIQHPSDLLPAVVLGAVVLTWVTGFDII